MKQLKLAVIALFTLVTVSNVSAQDENNPWAVGFGVNIVDFYNGFYILEHTQVGARKRQFLKLFFICLAKNN